MVDEDEILRFAQDDKWPAQDDKRLAQDDKWPGRVMLSVVKHLPAQCEILRCAQDDKRAAQDDKRAASITDLGR